MQQPRNHSDAVSPEYVKAPPPVVVTTQPTTVIMSPPAHKDYLTWSVLNMIFCCLPLGIGALVFSIKTQDANRYQDSLSAANHSHTAFSLNMAALGLGICLSLIYSILIIYGIAVARYDYRP